MIVPMKHLDLVCLASDRDATLERLRLLGAVHLELSAAGGEAVAKAKGDIADAERALLLIRKARELAQDAEQRPHSVAEVLAIDADRETLKAERERLEREIKAYEPYGDFDPVVATPIKFSVGSVVPGFATAVMRMEPGDHWRVYIPYQLGYGTVARGSIPAGSTLIFDLRLVKFWRKK